jgi:hypothetical protein
VCVAVALVLSDLPAEVAEGDALAGRVHARGDGEREARFYWRAEPPLLPVWLDGRLQLVRWGSRRGGRPLPPTGWTWRATVEAGRWAGLRPERVDIPATYCLAGGVWTRLKEGVRGLLVRDRAGEPVVYMLCEPATRYYRVMTRCEWMPVLIGEVI